MNTRKLTDYLALDEEARAGMTPALDAMPNPSLEEHDRRFHPNGYKEGDACKFREELARQDEIDLSIRQEVKESFARIGGDADYRKAREKQKKHEKERRRKLAEAVAKESQTAPDELVNWLMAAGVPAKDADEAPAALVETALRDANLWGDSDGKWKVTKEGDFGPVIEGWTELHADESGNQFPLDELNGALEEMGLAASTPDMVDSESGLAKSGFYSESDHTEGNGYGDRMGMGEGSIEIRLRVADPAKFRASLAK